MKGNPKAKDSINDIDNDSSATDTCSDPELMKDTDEATDTCSDPDFLKESDEEPSDNEEEREHYIIRYPSKSIVKKETNSIFSDPLLIDDPLEQVNKEIIIKNVVCRYCSFACDSDYILFTHIEQNHKKLSSFYTCNFPLCNFKSTNMLELITHKGSCQNNPDAVDAESGINPEEESEVQESNDQEKIINENDNSKETTPIKETTPLMETTPIKETTPLMETTPIKETTPLMETTPTKEKTPIIKVKPDYKLKSPMVQEPLISDEPSKSPNLVLKLKNPNLNVCRSLDIWKPSFNKLRYSNRPPPKTCQKHLQKCYKCDDFNRMVTNRHRVQLVRYSSLPHIDPFGEDLLFRIRVEIENQGLNDHNYSKINFFQRMGLNKLKNGSCKVALKNTLKHLKSKLDYNLLPNLRAYPEQMVLLHLIRQLEEIKSTYGSETFISKKSNDKEKGGNKNLNPVLVTKIPSGFSSDQQFKVLIPKKSMDKILLDSDAKLLIEGHVSSNKNLRRILPKKNLLEERKKNSNRSSFELSTRDEPTSSVKVLPLNATNIKRKNMNIVVQKLSTKKKVAVEKRLSDKITTNKAVDTKMNSEEKPTSFARESTNLKRKKVNSTEDQKSRKKITSNSRRKAENVVSKKTSSEELSKENVTENVTQKNSAPKDDQSEANKESESVDESKLQLSNNSSSAMEANNLVTLAHTCRKSKRRKIRKREGKGGYWTHKKNKVNCKACTEEKKK